MLGTAGAGDAFNSTFAAFIGLGRPAAGGPAGGGHQRCFGVGHVDTQTGLLKREEIDSASPRRGVAAGAHMVALRTGAAPECAL